LKAKYVNWLAMMFIRCYCFLMLPPAIIDPSLSIFVFTHRSLRTNPCIMCLRVGTVFGLVTSYFILPMRLIHSRYIGIDNCPIGCSHRSVLIVIYVVLYRWTREHGIVIASLLKRFLSLILIIFLAYIHIPMIV